MNRYSSIYENEFPNCCGMNILSEFALSQNIRDNLYWLDDCSKRNVQKLMKEQAKKDLEDVAKLTKHNYLIILNNEQHPYYHKGLLKLGWKCIESNMRNPNGGNRLYLYLFVVQRFLKPRNQPKKTSRWSKK